MASRWLGMAAAAAALLGTVVLTGCGGGGGGGETGVVRVALTDQAGYAQVGLAIREIRVVPNGHESSPDAALPLIRSYSPPLVTEVTDLVYRQLLLGEASVPVGRYNQVRLVLAPNVAGQEPVNYVTLPGDPDTRIPLKTPSGQQSGLKIVGSFEVEAGGVSVIVLDFAPDRAIVHTGGDNYIFKPTGIRLTQTDTLWPVYGALVGTIAPAGAWSTARIEVTPEGGLLPVAAGAPSLEDGTFRIPLPAGSYTIRVTATGYLEVDTTLLDPLVGVYVVSNTAETSVGTITLLPAP